MKIDIAIVNFRGADDVLACLDRLGAWAHGTVWLIDNSAHEPDAAHDTSALEQAAALRPWVKRLVPGNNLGFGCACNLAFEQSDAEFFLLLNPDARIANADVLLLARTLSENPQLAAVSPRIFWNNAHSFVLPAAFPQTPWHTVGLGLATRFQRLTRWVALRGLKRSMRQMASSTPFRVDFLAGSVLMIRRQAAIAARGLFDPDYFMFFEDSDLSLRLRRTGHRLAMVPAASAVHEYRHKAFKADLMATSQRQYFQKRYPAFFRWTDGLARLNGLPKPIEPLSWFDASLGPVATALEFAAKTDGARVLAFSPSWLMMPALVRPTFLMAQGFDESEWALMEPATYAALIETPDGKRKRSWICFERVAGAD